MGGTPTFFNPRNLEYLLTEIFRNCDKAREAEFGFEAHPTYTTKDHLVSLRNLGFQRVSYGVQDFDPLVQRAINRLQPFDLVEKAVSWARESEYRSVNLDLIYGLPFQKEYSIVNTIEKVVELDPDRIAFYSYAHVPWKSPAQRGYSDSDLPDDSYKRSLYELGRELLLLQGFKEVGMDHFAKPDDALYQAMIKGKLHRNFMGYTPVYTDLLIGLGASSISDAKYAYAQNKKQVEDYQHEIGKKGLAIAKGHFLSQQDHAVRKFITQLICQGESSWNCFVKPKEGTMGYRQLRQMEMEELLRFDQDGIRITQLGKTFIRNICKVFDIYLSEKARPVEPKFSKAI